MTSVHFVTTASIYHPCEHHAYTAETTAGRQRHVKSKNENFARGKWAHPKSRMLRLQSPRKLLRLQTSSKLADSNQQLTFETTVNLQTFLYFLIAFTGEKLRAKKC